MIIKTLRWKGGGFGRLVDYVGKELVDYVAKDETRSFGILHNLRHTDDLGGITQQFVENDAYRKQRKKGVVLYHEILSFHAGDRDAITPEMLEDITREYLRLRAPHALAFACPHYDRDHVHVHIAISGTELKSAKTLRMDNRTFTSVRRQIEHYQLSRYPELEHSIVHLPKKVRSKELLAEIEEERPVLERCYDEAQSVEDFLERVAEAGIDESKYPYDQAAGRFSFDIDVERLAELDRRMQELNALEKLRKVRKALELSDDDVLDGIIERYQDHVEDARPDTQVEQRLAELEEIHEAEREVMAIPEAEQSLPIVEGIEVPGVPGYESPITQEPQLPVEIGIPEPTMLPEAPPMSQLPQMQKIIQEREQNERAEEARRRQLELESIRQREEQEISRP